MSDDASSGKSSIHDRFFKVVFRRPAFAISLLKKHLPDEVVREFDWRSFEVISAESVDNEFKELRGDLIFKVQRAGYDSYIYPLLEHQRKQEKWMILRIAEYVLRLQRAMANRLAEEEKEGLPCVIPLVIHQGAKPWKSARSMSEAYEPWIEDTPFRDWVMQASFQVIDLAAIQNDRLSDESDTALILSLMKSVAAGTVSQWLRENREHFELLLCDDDDHEILSAVLNYMARAGEIEADELDLTAEIVHSEAVKNSIMTLAERLEERGEKRGEKRGEARGEKRGRKIGEKRGRKIGAVETLTRVFQRRFDVDFKKELGQLEMTKLDLLIDLMDQFETGAEVRDWIKSQQKT